MRKIIFKDARDHTKFHNTKFDNDKITLDQRMVPNCEWLINKYGKFFNLIYVKSNSRGQVIGHFTVYNLIAWRIMLCEEGSVPNLAIGLVSNPQNTKIWSDEVANTFDISFDWLCEEICFDNYHETKARFGALMSHYMRTGREKELLRIAEEVFKKRNLKEDDPIPPAQLDEIVAEISTRSAYFLVGLPYERVLSPPEIEALLKPDKLC